MSTCLQLLTKRDLASDMMLMAERITSDLSIVDLFQDSQEVVVRIESHFPDLAEYLLSSLSNSDFSLMLPYKLSPSVRNFTTLNHCDCSKCPLVLGEYTFANCGKEVEFNVTLDLLKHSECLKLLHKLGFSDLEIQHCSMSYVVASIIGEVQLNHLTDDLYSVVKTFLEFTSGHNPARPDYNIKYPVCGCGNCSILYPVKWSILNNEAHVSEVEGEDIAYITYKDCPVPFETKYSWMPEWFSNVVVVDSDDKIHHLLPQSEERIVKMCLENGLELQDYIEISTGKRNQMSYYNKKYGCRKVMILMNAWKLLADIDNASKPKWHTYQDKSCRRKAEELVAKYTATPKTELMSIQETMDTKLKIDLMNFTFDDELEDVKFKTPDFEKIGSGRVYDVDDYSIFDKIEEEISFFDEKIQEKKKKTEAELETETREVRKKTLKNRLSELKKWPEKYQKTRDIAMEYFLGLGPTPKLLRDTLAKKFIVENNLTPRLDRCRVSDGLKRNFRYRGTKPELLEFAEDELRKSGERFIEDIADKLAQSLHYGKAKIPEDSEELTTLNQAPEALMKRLIKILILEGANKLLEECGNRATIKSNMRVVRLNHQGYAPRVEELAKFIYRSASSVDVGAVALGMTRVIRTKIDSKNLKRYTKTIIHRVAENCRKSTRAKILALDDVKQAKLANFIVTLGVPNRELREEFGVKSSDINKMIKARRSIWKG